MRCEIRWGFQGHLEIRDGYLFIFVGVCNIVHNRQPLFDKIECANLAAKRSMENTDVQVIPVQ